MSEEVAVETTESTTPDLGGTVVDDFQAALDAVEASEKSEQPAPEPEAEAKLDGEAKAEEKDGEEDSDEEPKGPASRVWASVRKREQKLLAKRKEFEAVQQEWNGRLQNAEKRWQETQALAKEIEEDLPGFIARRGLSAEDVVRSLIGKKGEAPKPQPKAEDDDRVKAQEERLARLEESIRQREIQAKVSEYRANIRATLATEEFELLRGLPDAETEVYELADKWANHRNEVLTPREAAEKLQIELRKQLEKLGSNPAVRKLLGGADVRAGSGQSQAPRGNGTGSPKTLTNNLAATPSADPPSLDALSEEDEFQAALRLVQG